MRVGSRSMRTRFAIASSFPDFRLALSRLQAHATFSHVAASPALHKRGSPSLTRYQPRARRRCFPLDPQNAMAKSPGPYLIDGFPRSLSNMQAFEELVGQPQFMLFLDVSEEEMLCRLRNRGLSSGRTDDNEARRCALHSSRDSIQAAHSAESMMEASPRW
eukprot:425128-Pleurochrysis_carterae.AAC.4